jgi:site-specific DNA-cytosine methylase
MIKNDNNLTKKSINVLSLFDGISTSWVALNRAGININKYYSSEIDKNAIKVQNYHYSHYPNFIQLGDVRDVHVVDIVDTDLVIFGSPCTQLSAINKHSSTTGLQGKESSLFYEAIRILKDLIRCRFHGKNGLYFICENVASMSNKNRDEMTKALQELFPETILLKYDSADVTASHRRRYYWTNIPNQTPLVPNSIKFQDILENGYVDRDKANVILGSNVTLSNGIFRYYSRNIGNIVFKEEAFSRLSIEEKLTLYPHILKESEYSGKASKNANLLDFPNGCYRLLTPLESERCLGYEDGYISSVPNVSKTEKIKMIGLSFSPDVIAHITKPLLDIT